MPHKPRSLSRDNETATADSAPDPDTIVITPEETLAPSAGDTVPSKPNKRTGRKKTNADNKPVAELSRFEKYEVIEVHRSELKNAPYNPRFLSDRARAKLRDKINKVGLLGPIIWNKTTGHIVGGHQRVAIIDALEGTRDYRIRVAAVELDLATEKETNIFLNNEEAQGEWDMEKLEELLRDDTIKIPETGFDLGSVFQMFGDDVNSPLAQHPEQLEALAQKVRDARERHDKILQETNDRDDVNFYAVVVFENYDSRVQFTDTLGFADSRYIDGRALWSYMQTKGLVAGEESDELAAVKKRIKVNLCQRCGLDHDSVDFYPLANPLDQYTYYGECPENGQPILTAFTEATP